MKHLTRAELEHWREHGPDEDRERVVGHLAACDGCRQAYAEIVRATPPLEEAELDVSEFITRGRAVYQPQAFDSRRSLRAGNWWQQRRNLLVPASALAAAAVLVILVLPTSKTVLAPESGAIRGSQIQLVSPSGEVAAAPELRWNSPVVAGSFRVEIREASGAIVYSGSTREERAVLPPAAQALLLSGRPYTWTVEALDAAGETILKSRPATFTVR